MFYGIESDSAIINDATSITATFDNGVPVTGTSAPPSIRFVETSSNGRRLVSLSEAAT